MTTYETYSLIALVHGIGYLQTSLTEFVFFKKHPSAASYNLKPSMIISRKLSWLLVGSNSPGLWFVMIAKIVLGSSMLIFLSQKTIPFYWPLLMIFFDQVGFLRFRLIGRSETPLQRAALIAIAIHLLLDNETVSQIGLIFISFQLFLAYFATGYHKLKDPKWREGLALSGFTERYLRNTWIKPQVVKYKKTLRLVTYTVILFELLFFTSAFNSELAIGFFIFGIAFHLTISLFAGINEFLWVFVGCYPAVFFVSQMVHDQLSNTIFGYW